MLEELSGVGLDTNKILSQCYDGASIMSGREGDMQKYIQNKLNIEVPYIYCFNHQLHLVIVHAALSERAVGDFFDVCNALYKFLRKPTVAAQYNPLVFGSNSSIFFFPKILVNVIALDSNLLTLFT